MLGFRLEVSLGILFILGIVVARRTIAKYRESLQIPPASQRKSL